MVSMLFCFESCYCSRFYCLRKRSASGVSAVEVGIWVTICLCAYNHRARQPASMQACRERGHVSHLQMARHGFL